MKEANGKYLFRRISLRIRTVYGCSMFVPQINFMGNHSRIIHLQTNWNGNGKEMPLTKTISFIPSNSNICTYPETFCHCVFFNGLYTEDTINKLISSERLCYDCMYVYQMKDSRRRGEDTTARRNDPI